MTAKLTERDIETVRKLVKIAGPSWAVDINDLAERLDLEVKGRRGPLYEEDAVLLEESADRIDAHHRREFGGTEITTTTGLRELAQRIRDRAPTS